MSVKTINISTLPSIPLCNRTQLPKCPGIYFVLDGDCVLYIGKSISLRDRWATHQRWQQFAKLGSSLKIAWLESNDIEALSSIEKALIKSFNPVFNNTSIHNQITFTCKNELKEQLIEWAESENRTLSNLVETLAENALKEKKENSSPQRH